MSFALKVEQHGNTKIVQVCCHEIINLMNDREGLGVHT